MSRADHIAALTSLIDGKPDDELGEVLEPIRQYLLDETVRFFLCTPDDDSPKLVNAASEQEVYKLVTGGEWSDDVEDENWECVEITLKPGESLDLDRFV